MSKKQNNIFMFSPGGYGPYAKNFAFWADHIECDHEDEDDWYDSACDFISEEDTDYEFFFISRQDAENLVQKLQKLLEE